MQCTAMQTKTRLQAPSMPSSQKMDWTYSQAPATCTGSWGHKRQPTECKRRCYRTVSRAMSPVRLQFHSDLLFRSQTAISV